MHQSPQKWIGGRREKYGAEIATVDDDAVPQAPRHRPSQGKVRKWQWREEGGPAGGRPTGRQHPRG